MSERDEASKIASALRATLISPNETDSNFEPANVVDALFALGRMVADALNAIAESNRDAARAMDRVAASIRAGQQRKRLPGELSDLRNEDWSGWDNNGSGSDVDR